MRFISDYILLTFRQRSITMQRDRVLQAGAPIEADAGRLRTLFFCVHRYDRYKRSSLE